MKSKKVTAIIQARMASTRLPDKTLIEIIGKPMLWHLIQRVKKVKLIDEMVIATTLNPKDKVIVDFANRHSIKVFKGSEDDVLDRLYQVARKVKASNIVRITPDCPLLDPFVVDEILKVFLSSNYDYVTNTLIYTYPDGCDVEVFTFDALEEAWRNTKEPVEREHVTPYIRNSGKFKIKNVFNKEPVNPHEYRWCVDEEKDLEFVREVYKRLYKNKKIFSMKDVMNLLKKYPWIKKINSDIITNEGYYKSLLRTPPVKGKTMKIKNSLKLKEKAENLIPSCSQTFSKSPSQFVQGVSPVFIMKGEGSHIWDVDGNEYIDYAMALGPIILGHNYPKITNAVKKQLELGTTFTLPHRFEVELAEMLKDLIPCCEMVRFGKNGSDATSGAVRAARAYTGRDKIVCCGYHGWQDWYIATTTRNKGIPEEVKRLALTFEYNNIDSLKKIFDKNLGQIACVIMEPVGVVEPENNFLQKVREITQKNGALLIFDEIVTGFRLSLGGAQEYFGAMPDLACFGKAMGNGFPISAVVGKKEIMKIFDKIFYSFTFGGEVISIAASIATLKELKEKNVISYLWEQGRKIRDGYNVLVREFGLEKYTNCIGFPPRTIINFKNQKGQDWWELKSLFQQECIKRGILFTGAHNICFSHSNADIDYTLKVYRTVLEIITNGIKRRKVKKMLEGKPVEPVFRKA